MIRLQLDTVNRQICWPVSTPGASGKSFDQKYPVTIVTSLLDKKRIHRIYSIYRIYRQSDPKNPPFWPLEPRKNFFSKKRLCQQTRKSYMWKIQDMRKILYGYRRRVWWNYISHQEKKWSNLRVSKMVRVRTVYANGHLTIWNLTWKPCTNCNAKIKPKAVFT